GAGAGGAVESRLPAGLRRQDDAEGPAPRHRRSGKAQTGDRIGRSGEKALRAICPGGVRRPRFFSDYSSYSPALTTQGIEFLGPFHLFNNAPFTILLQRMPNFAGGRSYRALGIFRLPAKGNPREESILGNDRAGGAPAPRVP